MGPYLSLFIHGIEEVDKTCSDELKSMCEIHWPENVTKDKNCPLFGYIRHRRCVQLNNQIFTRFCKFFGFQWIDETTNEPCTHEPTVYDQRILLQLLQSCDFQSINGFKKFIHNQGIQTLYDYNDEKDLFWNIQHFGHLLRSLVPV